jgi:hypothetical protein
MIDILVISDGPLSAESGGRMPPAPHTRRLYHRKIRGSGADRCCNLLLAGCVPAESGVRHA